MSSGKRLQGFLDGQEQGDFGLVALWIVLQYYMSSGYSRALLLFFAWFCLRNWHALFNFANLEPLFVSWFCFMDRSSGLEMKKLCVCTRRGSVMQAMFPSSLHEPTTVEMVIYNFSFNVNFHIFHCFNLSCTIPVDALSNSLFLLRMRYLICFYPSRLDRVLVDFF